MIRLPKPVSFEWDEGNQDKNWLKHKVTVSEIEECFFDGSKRLARDQIHSTDDETRYILLGKTRNDRLLFIVFTVREKRVRVISARDLNRKERPLYEQKN